MTTFGKCTIYMKSELGIGIVKIEAKEAEVTVGPWAQWQNAVFCRYRKPRQRRDREINPQAYSPSLVILDGWGHPDPDSVMVEISRTDDMVVSQSKYSSFDERWMRDFGDQLFEYRKRTGAKVLADFRGHFAIEGYN